MTPRGISKSTEAKYGQLRNTVTDTGTWDANAGASFNPALMAGTRAAAISPAAPAQSRAFHSLTSSPRIRAMITKKYRYRPEVLRPRRNYCWRSTRTVRVSPSRTNHPCLAGEPTLNAWLSLPCGKVPSCKGSRYVRSETYPSLNHLSSSVLFVRQRHDDVSHKLF